MEVNSEISFEKFIIFFVVETICYVINLLFAFYNNVSVCQHLQVIFSAEKQDIEKEHKRL